MILIGALCLAVLIALVAALPIWPHSKNWAFYSVGGVSLLVLVVLYLVWSGVLHR